MIFMYQCQMHTIKVNINFCGSLPGPDLKRPHTLISSFLNYYQNINNESYYSIFLDIQQYMREVLLHSIKSNTFVNFSRVL